MVYLSRCLGVVESSTSFAAVTASRGCLALVVSAPAESDCSLCFAFDSAGGTMRSQLRQSMRPKLMCLLS